MRTHYFPSHLVLSALACLHIAGLLLVSMPVRGAETKPQDTFKVWPLHNPWANQESSMAQSKPFETPRFDNNNVSIHTPIAPLKLAPRVDPEGIFNAVSHCYPERSKFNLEFELQGRYSNRAIYDITSTDIGKHYFALVARMPLYSVTDLNREREREHARRTLTATTIGHFMAALADRNHAHRKLGLYSALEARSQIRVAQGVTRTNEQVGYLEKVATAQQELIQAESQLVQHRLILVAQCGEGNTEQVSDYLKQLTKLPASESEP